ncbi:sigma-70 family RNA polymerase sigma factor [Tabrizicola sp. WMC-M-20]|nr:sigma-70 family RNA polymerase sigma factor [Tabrizicola sp. WMC-M-20]
MDAVGISYRDALTTPLLSREQERAAIAEWQSAGHGCALEVLLRSHARLAHSQALRWTRNPAQVEDLVAEGIIGLIKAADRFDLTQDVRFSTYAQWWVMTCVCAAVTGVKTVVDLPTRTFLDARRGRMCPAERDRALAAINAVASLHGGGAGDDLAEITLECPAQTPEQSALAQSTARHLERMIEIAMAELDDPDREILRRHQLRDAETLDEIARDLGISRDRARQYEGRAMARMKRSLMAQGFSMMMLE